MAFDVKKLSLFPTDPGVYLMKDDSGRVLYVGKANNLRQRIKQYFVPGRDGRVIVPFLTAHVEEIDTIIVDSEKEALLLENNLIKKHQPKYNALLKDDKSYFSLMINHKHPWPMIRVVRFKGKPSSDALYFGPYTHAHAARQTLELLRHLFPLRQCSDRELVNRTRPCILYELKRCIAPCVAKCTKEEYDTYVQSVINFLRGHDAGITKRLKEEMERSIEKLEFEKANAIFQTIQNIEATLEKQKVENATRGDSDVLGVYREADQVMLVQMELREGKLINLQERFFTNNGQEDDELLSSFIIQHYIEKEFLPQEILLPVELRDRVPLESLLSTGRKRKVEIRFPLKGAKRALIEMANHNAEAKFKQRQKQIPDQKEKTLLALEEELHLINYPETIECFDNSNIGGTEQVSAMIVFRQGIRDPKAMRKYKLKDTPPSDDYAALKEVLSRRYRRAKEEDNLPDLVLIDGGKGHLNLALQVLSELDVSTVDVIAISKEDAKHTKGITLEKIYTPYQSEAIQFKSNSPALLFLQQVRDEAHRVAISFQRLRRKKRTLSSVLDTLPGIGPIKKKRLLSHFGSVKRILEASPEDLKKIPGITKKDLETLFQLSARQKLAKNDLEN